MSEYSKELIEVNWKILNYSYSQEEKKNADNYLIEFKNSPFLLEICKQLIESEDINSKFLGAFFIHQSLREKVNEISESKSEFMKYRDLIFLDLLEKLKNSNDMILERICFSVAILTAIGIISFWQECIEDVIKYAKISRDNCYISIIILQNIFKELNELQISGKKTLRIKEFLIEKNVLIDEFLYLLLEDHYVNKMNSSELQKEKKSHSEKFFIQVLDLIHSWLKLNLNLLKSPKILKYLFNCFSSEYSEIICEIFSESICLSSSAKLYIINGEYNIQTLIEKMDAQEIESISVIVDFIDYFTNNKIMSNSMSDDSVFNQMLSNKHFKLSNSEKNSILSNFANVFSAIFENFVNLIFMKNGTSGKLFSLLFFLLTNKSRKISSKLFMSFNELKEFINRGYKFNNYDDAEKKEFCEFLIKICENVMGNCKVSEIIVQKIVEGKSINSIDDLDFADPIDENADEMPINEYRKQSEEIFYDIFMVFLSNFDQEGVKYFFSFLNSILDQSDIANLAKYPFNDSRVFIVEVVLLVLNSIMTCFEAIKIYNNYLIEFIKKIMNSQILQSEKLIGPFLKFIDTVCPYISKESALYSQSIQIFTEIMKFKQFENICSLILLQITEFANIPSQENFNYLFTLYSEQYDIFSSYALGNFVEILANTIGISESDDDYESSGKKAEKASIKMFSLEEVALYFKKILQPAADRIDKTYLILEENLKDINQNYNFILINELNSNLPPSLIENIKISFVKNYNIYNIILKKSYFLNSKILVEIFYDFMNRISKIYNISMRFFFNDSNFIKENLKIFVKLSVNISNEMLPFFNYVNDLMLHLYVQNPENYICLNVLKALYSNVSNFSAEKKDYISNNFLHLSDCIKKNIIEVNKSNKLDIIVILCQFWTSVINSVDYLRIENEQQIYLFIDFILDAFRSVSEPDLNKSILKLISNFISSSGIISREIIFFKYKDIMRSIYGYLENLAHSCIPQLIQITKNLAAFDQNLFVESLLDIINNSNCFSKLKPNQKQTLVEYISLVHNTDNKLKVILNELINLTKGMNESDFIIHCEFEIALMKRKK